MAQTQEVSRTAGIKISSVALAGLLFGGSLTAWAAKAPLHAVQDAALESGHDSRERIRVRLTEGVEEARLHAFDLTLLEHGRSVFRADRLSNWTLHCDSMGKVEFTEVVEPARAGETTGTPLPRRLGFTSPVALETPAGFLSFQGKPYRERLRVYAGKRGCEVVNEVDLEEYLDGLVNSEFSAKWSEEAVAAQVVAARTYAYSRMLQSRKKASQHFDVESTVKDQVYGGSAAEDFRAARIIEKTRGLVLTVPGGAPLKAFYHSTCGGQTELPEHVWGAAEPGFKHKVICPYCKHSPAFNWKLKLGSKEILDAIRNGIDQDGVPVDWPAAAREAMNSGKLIDFAMKRDDSERVLELGLVWLVGSKRVVMPISGVSFRNWLGAGRFRSTAFNVSPVPGGWAFSGRGNGHGVGMCQWGAKVMAEQGKTYAAILKLYYPDARLTKLW